MALIQVFKFINIKYLTNAVELWITGLSRPRFQSDVVVIFPLNK